MGDRPQSSGEARELMLDWAEGKRSWTNLGNPHGAPPYTPAMIAAMDAQEVVKWGAVWEAMAKVEATF